MLPPHARQYPVAGIVITLVGLVLTCCLCPLALNAVVVLGSDGKQSVYGAVFANAPRVGSLPLSNYVSGFQLMCAGLLGLIVLVAGVFILAGNRSKWSKPGSG